MDFNKEKTCINSFIELTNTNDTKFLININKIQRITNVDFGGKFIVFIYFEDSLPSNYIEVKESYEEICELLKNIC